MNAAGGEYIGGAGTGLFTQTGGTHNVNSSPLYLGSASGGSGTYNLVAGTLNATEYVGQSGTGLFNQTGGTATGGFVLGVNSSGVGTYNFGAGQLSGALGETVGQSGTGTFNQSGGTNAVTGNLYIGYGSTGKGTYNQLAGLTTVSTALYLGYNSGSNGTYALSGTAPWRPPRNTSAIISAPWPPSDRRAGQTPSRPSRSAPAVIIS